jgi:hypothetical protein
MRNRSPLPDDIDGRAFTVREARSAGVTAHRLRADDLRAPHRAVRVPGFVEETFEQRCLAVATVLAPDQFFTHTTAARLWGVPLPSRSESELLHVASSAPRRAPRMRGVVGHQIRDRRVRVLQHQGLRVIDPASCWLQLCDRLDHLGLVAAADHLVCRPHFAQPPHGRPFTERMALARRLEAYRGRGRRNGLLALERSRDGVASLQETRLRLLLVDAGLPEPVTDFHLDAADGHPEAWLDLYYPGLRLAVEYDGQQHRTDDRQYARDVVRLGSLYDRGFSLVRLDRTALAGDGSPAVAAVRSRMHRLGWPKRQAL